jgi:hypothetical protein
MPNSSDRGLKGAPGTAACDRPWDPFLSERVEKLLGSGQERHVADPRRELALVRLFEFLLNRR